MRAKLAVVVFVVFGLLGAVAVSAGVSDQAQLANDVVLTTGGNTVDAPMTPADRGRGHHHDHDGDDDDECIAKDEAVIGPVCIEVDDVISDILST